MNVAQCFKPAENGVEAYNRATMVKLQNKLKKNKEQQQRLRLDSEVTQGSLVFLRVGDEPPWDEGFDQPLALALVTSINHTTRDGKGGSTNPEDILEVCTARVRMWTHSPTITHKHARTYVR